MSEMFSLNDIENDPIVQSFFNKKSGLQKSTIESYLYSLKSFCNFTEKTPTEVHDIHKNDLRERVAEFDMWLNDAFDNYVAYLIKSDDKAGTIKLKVGRVKSFLHAFKLKPTPTPEVSKRPVLEGYNYALTIEDIRKAIANSSPTYQTLFITLAQTGLSLIDALLFDVGDFIKAVSKKNEDLTLKEAIYRAKTDDNLIGCFDLRRKKTSIQFYTFAGPETLRSIASLLESKDDRHLKSDCPIFMKDPARLSRDKRECFMIDPDMLSKEDRKCLMEDLRLIQNLVSAYTGRMHKDRNIFPTIEVDGKEINFFRPHKLRKWFSNQLKNGAQFDLIDTKYLMGHMIGDVAERYFDPNNYTSLKNNYRRALPYLAINDEVIMEENLEAIETLQEENKALKERINQHEHDIADVSSKFDDMESQTAANVLEMFEELMNSKTGLTMEDVPSAEIAVNAFADMIKSLRKKSLEGKK